MSRGKPLPERTLSEPLEGPPTDERAAAASPAASWIRRDEGAKTRLVLYVKGFPPRETGGPVEVAFHVTRELLRAHDLHVTLIVQTDSSEAEIRGLLGNEARLTVIRLPYYPSAREATALAPILHAFATADLVHFNEFPFRHLPLVVLAKARGVPVVYSLHGLLSQEIHAFLGPSYPLTFQEGAGAVRVQLPGPVIDALVALYRSFARAWTAVITPSEALRREATARESFLPSRVFVIPHGVERPRGPPSPAASSDHMPRILYVGKLEEIKGPDLLLDAVGRLLADGILLDVSIVGGGSLESRLKARAEHVRPSRIRFLGVRRGEELGSLYAEAEIVVVPSRHETLSMVVLEAMAAGRPILATRVGGIPEIVSDPRNALLVDPDPASLADGMRRLLEDPRLRASMAQANLADASQRSWPKVVDRYVQLYHDLLEPRRSRFEPRSAAASEHHEAE